MFIFVFRVEVGFDCEVCFELWMKMGEVIEVGMLFVFDFEFEVVIGSIVMFEFVIVFVVVVFDVEFDWDMDGLDCKVDVLIDLKVDCFVLVGDGNSVIFEVVDGLLILCLF